MEMHNDDWDNRGACSNWHSGLKTLPKGGYYDYRRGSPSRMPAGRRWDIENDKTLGDSRSKSAPHQRPREFVHTGEWSSGLKTLDNSKIKAKDVTKEIANHRDHGAVKDWEYTGTLHKTLEHTQPKGGHESWMTENAKVLGPEESYVTHPWERHSPYSSPTKKLETETSPTEEWSAGHKVVPGNRARKFMTNNQTDYTFRQQNVLKKSHLPSDGSWNTENFKIVDDESFRRGAPADDWEGGYKVMKDPISNTEGLAWDRRHNLIGHPFSWFDESHKTLSKEHMRGRKRNPYKYVNENTGWDSGLYKTFDPEEARERSGGLGKRKVEKQGAKPKRAYAANDEWACQGKVLPHSQSVVRRKHYENYGTGWDSGLKVLPYEQSHRRRPQSGGGTYYDIEGVSHTRNVRPDNWGVENRKTLGWESTGTYGLPAEGYRHIAMPRHMDMMQFHKRICGHENVYAY
jgi:hypothetical protein